IDGAARDARAAFNPLAELGAAHEFGRERYGRMRPANAGGMARARPHHHVGHGYQKTAMRPTHRIAVPPLERQADAQSFTFRLEPERADQSDEFVRDVELAETVGDELVHAGNPSLETASFSSAARTSGSNGMLRCVSSFSDTMMTFCTAVHWPSPS